MIKTCYIKIIFYHYVVSKLSTKLFLIYNIIKYILIDAEEDNNL